MHAPAAALVVTSDRAAIDRFYRPLLIVVAVGVGVMLLLVLALMVLVGAMSGIGDGTGVVTLLPVAILMPIVLLTAILQLGAMTWAWASMRELRERVVADRRGLALSVPSARIRMPWAAVQEAALRGSGRREHLVLRVDGALVEGEVDERQRRRIAKRGIVVHGVGMQPGLDAVAHAIASWTEGRVVPQRR